jgi:hypothetical protein
MIATAITRFDGLCSASPEPFVSRCVAGAAMTYVKPQNNRGDATAWHQGDNRMDEDETVRISLAETRLELEREPKLHSPETHSLSDLTQKRIGMHLRAMYDTIVQQPVPDRFRDLIARMDDASGQPFDEK